MRAQVLSRMYTPQSEKRPNGVPLETCQYCRAAVNIYVPERFLELAKGLEPPTL